MKKTYSQELADVNHWYMRRQEQLKSLGLGANHKATNTMEAERLRRIEEVRRKYSGDVDNLISNK